MAEITNIQEAWEGHSGQEVENYIKENIRQQITDLAGKFGSVSYESGRMVFYDHEGGTQLGAVTITGTSYSVNVSTNQPTSNITILTSDTTYPITLTPTTTSMEFGSTEQNDYPEDYTFKLEVDSGSGYVDKTPAENTIRQGGSATVDIKPFIVKVGTNRVRIVVTGVSSGQPRVLGYSVTLTSLSLSCNHPWQKVWVQGQDFAITRIFFNGNIAKTLYVKVGDNVYEKKYSASTSYDTVPTEFDLTNATPAESGIIPIEIWMTGDGVETQHIHYNIMYVTADDVTEGNVSLICVNNVKDFAYNFTQEVLLEYAVYNINSIAISVDTIIQGTPSETTPVVSDVIPQTVYQLTRALQIDTTETEGISLLVTLQAGDTIVTEEISVDNSKAYLPTEGYKFYLNTSLGNNDSADREHIVNSAALVDDSYSAVYTGNWSNFTFADDAWGEDTDGNRALVVKAGSILEVSNLKPLRFSNKSATLEFMFRASNIADYDKPIMTIMDTEEYNENSVGLMVFPTKILLLGTGIRQELFQQLPLSEDRIHHIGVVIQRGYGSSDLNLARIFINGCENVTFQFTGTDLFYNSSGNNQLRIGQASTDTYLYMMRIYDKALEGSQLLANYLNVLIETAETMRAGLRDDNNILDGNALSYHLCKEAGFNCLVIEIEGDKAIPSLENQGGYPAGCNYHFEYNDHPEWNVSIYNAPIEGQGTTSSKYAWWNLRMKNKNKLRWVYPNLTDSNGNVLEETSVDGYIAGDDNPKVSRITWKKNIASQPQGHKMGATMLYNDIYKRIMGGGDKLVADNILPTADARVAVYQYPFLGFQKFSDGTYKFIGLYTGGPDKGDKKTFGYNATEAYPRLMMIEGPNHDPVMTRFLVPWTEDVFYDYDNETLSVGAPSATDGNKEEGWDADIISSFSTDKAENKEQIETLYESEFKPAYDAIYYNSLYIASLEEALAPFSGTAIIDLASINANLDTFRKGKTNGHSNNLMTFYDSDYSLIYYRIKTGKYEVLPKSASVAGVTAHNMLEYLGLSGTPTTEDIITARKANWLTAVSQFVNMREAYYRQAFDEFIGASDNDAKNSYWRKFLAIEHGGKWGFNEDDLDTIFQNDNNGQDTKDYFAEPDDTSELGADIFQGRTSAFWYALRQICKDQLKGMMKEIVDAMYAEAEVKKVHATTIHQTIFNLIEYYFWRVSSKYFPATAYNKDTQLAYIDVWYKDPGEVYNNVPPLTQIHGDHYETEREWVSKRIAYMFSKYQIGAFQAGGADGYGSLDFTPAEGFTMNVTPAIDLYPRVSYGGAETQQSQRTKAGETCPLVLSASGTTGNYIKAMDWLSELGDLSGLKLSPRSAADAAISFSVKGKRLRKLQVGAESSDAIAFNASSLAVESEALEELDARNASSITGLLDLQKCPRLREVYLSGTRITSAYPQSGGRISTLQLPDTLQALVLPSLNLLTEEGLQISDSALANLRSFYVNGCDKIDAVALLQRIMNLEGNQLTGIGLIWKGWKTDTDGSLLRMFGAIAAKAGVDGGYSGVDFTEDISTMTSPNIVGALDARGLNGVYKEDIDNITSKLTNLQLEYNKDKLYIYFEDSAVLKVLLDNKVGDGTGITTEQAEAVTSIGTWFKGNVDIDSFEELDKFTGVTTLSASAFEGCSSLNQITIGQLTSIGNRAFYNCTSLEIEDLQLPNLTSLGQNAFYGVKIKKISNLGRLTDLPSGGDNNSRPNIANYGDKSILEEIILPSTITSIPVNAFYAYSALKNIVIPEGVKSIGQTAFASCTSLTMDASMLPKSITYLGISCFNGLSLSGELNLPNLETLNNGAFRGTKIEKITDLGVITATVAGDGNSGTFGNCSLLTMVVLPETLTALNRAFLYNCPNIETMIVKATTPPPFNTQQNSVGRFIYVPDASVGAYQGASGWSTYADRIKPLSKYVESK